MAEIGNRLRIKYGMVRQPTTAGIRDWVREVEGLVRKGHRPEDAGQIAAERVFPGAGEMLFKTEADTIEALLEEAKKK